MRTLRSLSAVIAVSTLAAAAAACGGAAPAPVAPVAKAPPAGCGRVLDASRSPVPLGLTRQGSTVALAKLGGQTLAYIADEDDSAVHVVDVDTQKDIAKTTLPGKPGQLMFLADGRLVVAIRDQAQLAVLEPGADATKPMDARCAVGTDAEPVGVAISPDDSTIVVTAGWGKSLASYDAKSSTMARQWDVALPREPRGVVVSDDGTRAFVAQAVGGQLSVVDLKMRQVIPTPTHFTEDNLKAAIKSGTLGDNAQNVRFNAFGGNGKGSSCQGFALAKTGNPGGRVLIPQAEVDPGDPNENPSGYGSSRQDQAEVGDIAVIDEGSGELFMASLQVTNANLFRQMQSSSQGHDHQECLLPRSAAYDAKRHALLVGCFGIDDVVSYDALAASPIRAMRRRWDVAAGPTGIAVDTDKDRAVVWSQFERTVNVIQLGGSDLVDDKGPDKPPPVAHFALNEPTHPMPVNIALGRVLFNMVGDERISHDGRACASCHPDGRDDSLVWSTPNGPRRSIMLAGRVGDTAPFSWSGTESSIKEHIGITFSRLKGTGDLRSMELSALADYILTLSPPPGAMTKDTAARVARGNEIFHSAAAACSTCHSGPSATDNEKHDVQSKTAADKNGNFNTPSLRFVGGGGPYFHDGRYKTLRQLLTDADRKMGHTAQLSNDDLEALEAYLRTL
jgi:mono/diheme cytochrome c family protein